MMLVRVGEAVGLEALDDRFHLALLEILVQGAHHAQVLQHRLKRVHGEVDVFQGGVAAERQAQRSVGDLVGKADGQKHMARIQRAGGAGAPGGHADAPGGQLATTCPRPR